MLDTLEENCIIITDNTSKASEINYMNQMNSATTKNSLCTTNIIYEETTTYDSQKSTETVNEKPKTMKRYLCPNDDDDDVLVKARKCVANNGWVFIDPQKKKKTFPQEKTENDAFGLNPKFLKALGLKLPLKRTIIVKGLHTQVTEGKLFEIFSMAGEIRQMELLKPNRQAKIVYDHPVEAVQAISMFHNHKLFNEVMEITMEVKHSRTNLPLGLSSIGKGFAKSNLPLRHVSTLMDMRKSQEILSEMGKLKKEVNDPNSPFLTCYKKKQNDSLDGTLNTEQHMESSSEGTENVFKFSVPGTGECNQEPARNSNSSTSDILREITKIIKEQGLILENEEIKNTRDILNALKTLHSETYIIREETSKSKVDNKVRVPKPHSQQFSHNICHAHNVSNVCLNPESERERHLRSTSVAASRLNKLNSPPADTLISVMSVLQPGSVQQNTGKVKQIFPQKSQPSFKRMKKNFMPSVWPYKLLSINIHDNDEKRRKSKLKDEGDPKPDFPQFSQNILLPQNKSALLAQSAHDTYLQPESACIEYTSVAASGIHKSNSYVGRTSFPFMRNVTNSGGMLQNVKDIEQFLPQNSQRSGPFMENIPQSSRNAQPYIPPPTDMHRPYFRHNPQQFMTPHFYQNTNSQRVKNPEYRRRYEEFDRISDPRSVQNKISAGSNIIFQNLPRNIDKETLAYKIKEVGDLVYCKVFGDGTASVRFRTAKDSDRCLHLFHRCKVDGRVIDVFYEKG